MLSVRLYSLLVNSSVTNQSHLGSAYPTDPDNTKFAYSGYWGQALKNHCPDPDDLKLVSGIRY